jgi:hypothetical protein
MEQWNSGILECWIYAFPVTTIIPKSAIELEPVYKFSLFVIPAKAGIQSVSKRLDSRFHGNDKKGRLRHLWTDSNESNPETTDCILGYGIIGTLLVENAQIGDLSLD